MTYHTITACRSCGLADLTTVLDLGNLCLSDFPGPGDPEPQRAPLELVRCAGCTLVQLRHTVDRDRLYREYHYRSGVNETMVAALADVVKDAWSRVTLNPGDAVLDIGSNDGTLLGFYPKDVRRIGFDPSDVAREAWVARDFDYDLIRDFFPTSRQHTPVKCKIVTAIACFYDVDDPNAFLSEVKRWLHPDGVLVLQFQDLGSMVRQNAVDNICHEHLTYWDLHSLSYLFDRHGFAWRTELRNINGGSLRLIARRANIPGFVHPPVPLYDFALRVNRARSETLGLLHRLRNEGKRVYGIAASTKFNTLSQYFGIGPDLVTAIGERSPAKWGKRTVTGIPIVSEDEMRAEKPDYLLTGAWQFADAFAEREKALLDAGAKLIVPLPELRIVSAGSHQSRDLVAHGGRA